MSAASIWELVLGRIESKVGRHSFHTWFKPTSLLSDDGRRVSVKVPNLLFTEWLPKHYSVVLAEALRDVGRTNTELIFVAEEGQSIEASAPDRTPRPSADVPLTTITAPAGLNPRYTFDTFIVGPSNQFANAA